MAFYKSDYNEEDEKMSVHDRDDDLRSCASMRMGHFRTEDRDYNAKLVRYKSIERQHAKYVHNMHQLSQQIEQNKVTSDAQHFQYLSERLNEQVNRNQLSDTVNSRLAHLLSPKLPLKSSKSCMNRNMSNASYNEKIQYLLNKNNQRQQQQQQQQQNYHTIDYQRVASSHHDTRPQDRPSNVNLANYLTWKNFGNIYPSAETTANSHVDTVDSVRSDVSPLESPAKQSDVIRGYERAIRTQAKSMSTPNTPQLFTLPRCVCLL